MRTPRYRSIADELRRRVAAGDVAVGELLPSESTLSAEFEASRVTVRRALEELRADGLIGARQGLGWYVAGEALHQVLDELDTMEDQLMAAGVTAQRQVLDFAFVPAPEGVVAAFGPGPVLEVRRLNLADGVPFARVTVWCPEPIGAQLSRDDVERRPFYDLMADVAGIEFSGATQTIAAAAASAPDAELLAIPSGSPVLNCVRTTRAADGEIVLISEHVYPGHLTAFSVELPSAGRAEMPAGLRLVE